MGVTETLEAPKSMTRAEGLPAEKLFVSGVAGGVD